MREVIQELWQNLRALAKWILFAGITGALVGLLGVVFGKCMAAATDFRANHDWVIWFLPAGGMVIIALYHLFKVYNPRGTNLILAAIHAEEEIPLHMAPLISISTVITHLVGGSAGREGAALQLGGSIGNQLGKWFRFDDKDKRVVVMCGMSAAFSALFGTPLAAAIFPMEVVSVGIMHYAALVPCVFASLVAKRIAVFSIWKQRRLPCPKFQSSRRRMWDGLFFWRCCAGCSARYSASCCTKPADYLKAFQKCLCSDHSRRHSDPGDDAVSGDAGLYGGGNPGD